MNVQGLDGRVYKLKLGGHAPQDGKSAPHLRARRMLFRLFPLDPRLEEIHVPGPDKLFLDFFLPARRLVVEVQGSQHYEFNAHFHGHRLGFLNSLKRDRRKQEWCELNEFRLVELPHDEDDTAWKRRILGTDEREGEPNGGEAG